MQSQNAKGYTLDSLDGEIGKVKGFYFDDQHWAIRYLVIDKLNWWPGKMVLISPDWIERVSWLESKVFVNLPLATIRQAPEFKAETLLTRDYETRLYAHYHRPGYWVDDRTGKSYRERRVASRDSASG